MRRMNKIAVWGLFAWVLTVCAAVSCIDESGDEPLPVERRDVLLSVAVKQGERGEDSRSAGATAYNRAPLVHHVYGFFLYDGTVVEARQQALSGNKATFTDIPNYVNKMMVIGYPEAASSSPAVPTAVPTEKKLMQTLVEVNAQDSDDPAKVNTFGSTAVDFSMLRKGETASVTIDMAPVVSRIEIVKVDPSDPPASLSIKKAVTQFSLDAVYVNNTYQRAGLDRATCPAADAVAFGGSDIGADSPWGNPALYASGFCDHVNGTGASGYAAGSKLSWNYYVMPLPASLRNGTVINGQAQGVLPHIVLKLSDIRTEGSSSVIAGPLFLTIKSYKDLLGFPVTEMKPGKVYRIPNIAFGLEHLSVLPEMNASEYILPMSVVDWTDMLIEQEVR